MKKQFRIKRDYYAGYECQMRWGFLFFWTPWFIMKDGQYPINTFSSLDDAEEFIHSYDERKKSEKEVLKSYK